MFNIARSAALLVLIASPLSAQRTAGGARGGRQQTQQVEQPPVQPPVNQAAKADTGVIRKTPTGYVLDFQDQDIRVVMAAVAEAGDINITFSNMPAKRVSLRMGKAVSHDDLVDVLRGLAESNGLKFSQTGSFIRIEGTPVVSPQQQQQSAQQLAQQQAQALAQQNQLHLYTYRLKHVSATTIAPVIMNLVLGSGNTAVVRAGANGAVQLNGAGGIPTPFQIQGAPNNGRGGNAGGLNITTVPAGNGANAQTIADALTTLGNFGGGGGGGGGGRGGGGGGALAQQLLQQIQAAGLGGANAQVPSAPGSLSAAASDIRVVAEESTNSLMIRATAQDYQILQGLIQTVDLRPLQVLIEVTIAEVQRNKDLDVGISGSASQHKGTKDTTSVSFPTAATARDFVLMLTGGKGAVNYDVALNALQTRGDVKVLSMPIIIAQNNKEAILNVGSRQPFVQVTQSSPLDPTSLTRTIQYIDVGKTLTITPTINADGYVNLAVKQTDNNATNAVQFDAPIINTREATTQVFLRTGQTTVIGGLADNSESKTVSGIPILSRIPLIGGWLFGNTVQSTSTSELFLFLTPHIISDDTDIDRLRDGVRDGSELLQNVPTQSRIQPPSVTPPVMPRPTPDTTPARIQGRPPVRPDSTRRPPPPEAVGDSAKKVQVPVKKGG